MFEMTTCLYKHCKLRFMAWPFKKIADKKKLVHCGARQNYSPESFSHIYKSNIRPCFEYCCQVCSGYSAIYLDSWQIRRICNVFHGNCSEFSAMVPGLNKLIKCSIILSSRFHSEIVRCKRKFYANGVFYHTSHVWNTSGFLIPSRLWSTKKLNEMLIVILS